MNGASLAADIEQAVEKLNASCEDIVRWIDSMEHAGGQFIDPALWDRRPPDWPQDDPWPSAPMKATVNQYAQGCRGIYRGEIIDDMSAAAPPEGWPMCL